MTIKTRSKPAHFVLAVVLFAVAIFAPPALAANVVAGALGLFVLNGHHQPPQALPATLPARVVVIERPKVIKVKAGVVIFEQRGQQMVSRFYPS